MKISDQKIQRPLFADFQIHTDGDPDFKKELIGLMIDNLLELSQSFQFSMTAGDFTSFRMAGHKMNSTLGILADDEFLTIVDEIKKNGADEKKALLFNSLCAQIIDSLKASQ
jgi:hypothetical protein